MPTGFRRHSRQMSNPDLSLIWSAGVTYIHIYIYTYIHIYIFIYYAYIIIYVYINWSPVPPLLKPDRRPCACTHTHERTHTRTSYNIPDISVIFNTNSLILKTNILDIVVLPTIHNTIIWTRELMTLFMLQVTRWNTIMGRSSARGIRTTTRRRTAAVQ